MELGGCEDAVQRPEDENPDVLVHRSDAAARYPPSRKLKAGEMCWFTDRTPHESLPLPAGSGGKRQFFRLVTSEVSLWYAEHSTANPLCKVNSSKTKVLEGSKFLTRAGVVG